MKKSLIALAIASAMAAPAFAATSNVDIYGQLDMSVNSVNNDSNVAGDDERLGGVSSNNSRFGIKGAEDLGGGLSGIWQFEQTINMDGDGGSFGSLRNTYLGLAGKPWGSVKLGRIDTPYKSATARLDMFADTYGDYNMIIGSLSEGSNLFDVRQTSSVLYETPSFSGFSFAAMYGFRNEAASNTGNGTASDPRLYSLAASYANGPLFASLAYESQKEVDVDTDAKGMKLGLGYNFGNLVLGGVYERLRAKDSLGSADRNAWMLGAGYTMGNIVMKAQYATAGEFDSGADDAAKYYAVGADYILSKRTKVYAMYTSLDNDSGASYTFANATSDSFAPELGVNPTAFSLGVRHTF